MWYKLIANGIHGKCFNYTFNYKKNMYMETKSMIKMNSVVTDFFTCNDGVRQGENLYPFFFSLYINDLDMFLREKGIVGLQSVSIKVNWGRINYLKLFILLYADDTVIMAVSARDLQHALNEFSVYCRKWKVEKTKYMYLICWKGPMSKIVFIIMEEL